jgi:hypothetical protein
VVKIRQKKKGSLVVQGLFLTKSVDMLFLWFVVHGGNFIGGTEMGTRI